ncbi:MAG: hypothetical protein HYZ79_02730 [Candidatus Melainabacteria bacterium]|nr:hypothetical protein [Candidatus Melainabacteria bacterium]
MTTINPVKLSSVLVSKVPRANSLGQTSDSPLINIYKIKRFNSSIFGPTLQVWTTGCPYRCAMCWVSDEALGIIEGEFLKEKLERLPAKLKEKSIGHRFRKDKEKLWGKLLETVDEKIAKSIFEVLEEKLDSPLYNGLFSVEDVYKYVSTLALKRNPIPTIVFSGGSPTMYQRSLFDFSTHARDDNLKVGIITEGFHIGQDTSFLDDFNGEELQDTVNWAVTIKNVTPPSFNQLTGVPPNFYRHHFITLRELLRNGFPTTTILLANTFAIPKDLELANENNPVHILHDELSLSKDFPMLLIIDKVYYGSRVDDSERQRQKMAHRGYIDTRPGLVTDTISRHFKAKGTPLMDFTPQAPVMKKGRRIIEETIETLNGGENG